MKVALVSTSFFPHVGGAEFVVHHLACQWSRQGHKVQVINCVSDQTPYADGLYTVARFKTLRGSHRFGYHRWPFSWHAVRGVGRLLREFRPDFISAHFGYPTAVWLSRIKPIPKFLVTCHGSELVKFPWGDRVLYNIDGILTEALNASAGVVAISRHARCLLEELGVERPKILDIPNGVDLDRFRCRADVEFRGRFGLPKDALVVLSVGRQHAAKAYDTGLKAFAKVAHEVPNAYYVILGRGTEMWLPLAEELGIQERAVFCPGLYGDELIGAYQQADIFFSPSVQEMLPLVVLEAMAGGLAGVVTNVSGSQDLIETGCNGIVVEPGAIDDMATAMIQLARDPGLRQRMGQANSARVQHYGWDHVSRMYLQHA